MPKAKRCKLVREVTPMLIVKTAMEYIDEYGWTRFKFGSKEEGFCIIGAIEEATGDLEPIRYRTDWFGVRGRVPTKGGIEAVIRAETALTQCIGKTDIPDYNDHIARSKEEVLEKFRCALQKLEEGANANS
jgi:hypothetical protein